MCRGDVVNITVITVFNARCSNSNGSCSYYNVPITKNISKNYLTNNRFSFFCLGKRYVDVCLWGQVTGMSKDFYL